MTETNRTGMAISVIIPTYKRVQQLLRTIEVVKGCCPFPDEIIVHVDGGDDVSAAAVRSAHSDVIVLQSVATLGPGGSRNRLLKEAKNEIVVSLDDDSFPLDSDFFSAVLEATERRASAGVFAMNIIHDDEPIIERSRETRVVADFVGCGCAYRRTAFRDTEGFVPVQPAYGVEEADLSLQLHDKGWSIVLDESLRVRHATSRSHQASASITSAHISNLALLAFLRYPARYWPLGLVQVANRVFWSLTHRRHTGIVFGIFAIPRKIWRYKKLRRPVRPSTMRELSYLRREAK